MSQTDQDQKTEEPTARRFEKALEDGQIAFSSELVGGVMLLAAVLFFWIAGRWFFDAIKYSIAKRSYFIEPLAAGDESITRVLFDDLQGIGLACLGLMLPVFLISIMTGIFQTNLNISFKPFELNINKMSPAKGLKRIFSTRSVNRTVISLLKATAICLVILFVANARLADVADSGMFTLQLAVQLCMELLLATGMLIAILMVFIGGIDLIFQKWKHHQDLKMSLQELRDELKETEGDPMVKARVRKIRNELGRKRMLEGVKQASFVVTNPTHYAVALRYEPESDDAPVVVAKGCDHLALKIIELAKQSGISVVERKPLARFLYANVDVGQEIPFEVYQAIAEILIYIRRQAA